MIGLILWAGLLGAYAAEGVRSFRVTSIEAWKEKDLYVKDGAAAGTSGMRKIQVYPLQYSSPIKYTVGQPIQFFHQAKDKKSSYTLALTVSVPPKMKQPLLLLSKKENTVSGKIFEVDPKHFPFGACMFVNLTGKKLALFLKDDSHVLAPEQNHVFPTVKGKQGSAGLRVKDSENQNLVYFSAMLMQRTHKRQLMFITDDPAHDKRVVVKTLSDFQPAAPKKKPVGK